MGLFKQMHTLRISADRRQHRWLVTRDAFIGQSCRTWKCQVFRLPQSLLLRLGVI